VTTLLRKLSTRKRDGGFTLIELIVVMSIIAILALVAVPVFTSDIRAAKEAALKEDLHVMRTAIQSYTEDKNKAPQSLDDLVQEGYIAAIPTDPMTNSKDTWQTDSNDTFSDLDQTESGITDVHSGSDNVGSDGQPYSSW
jgi:general secretion pathway protein G